jgi:hypothetical protein
LPPEAGAASAHFGIPNLLVLTVAPSQARVNTMIQTLIDLRRETGSAKFLFKTIPVLGMDAARRNDCATLFTKPWTRAKAVDFYLNKSA